MPTINNQRTPRHKTTGITKRKERRAPKLLRNSQPPQHILRLPHRPRLWILLKHLLNHRRDDMARTQTIHTDTMAPPLHSQTPRKLDHGRLGRIVDRRGHALVRDQPAHAGDEQDRALLLAMEHLPRRRGGCVEHAVVVDLHDLVQRALRVVERALQVVDSRGGDHAVQTIVCGRYCGEGILDFRVVAHVDPPVLEAAAEFLGCVLFCVEEVCMR